MADYQWPCACVRRKGGNLKAIKMHPYETERCRKCGAERPASLASYRCVHCGKVTIRESDKQWVKSYCVVIGKTVHLQRIEAK